MRCLHVIKRACRKCSLGAGTILTPAQVAEVTEIGVDFAVSPGCNSKILQAAAQAGLFFGPGIATASEIETALEMVAVC